LEDKNLQLTELGNLADLARLQGDTTRAGEFYEQVLAQARDSGQKERIASCLSGLGHIRLAQGDLDTAKTLLRESLRLLQEIGFESGVPYVLAGLGRIAAAQGQAAGAARVMGAVDAYLTRRAARLDADAKAELEQDNAAVRAALTPEEFETAFVAGQPLTLEQAIQELSGLERVEGRVEAQPLPPAAEKLHLCAFGPMRVRKGEQAVTAWPYAKVKELLFYLVSYPARTKAQIGLALWPEASPMQLRNSLGTTLYHLRRALGNPQWIVFEGDQYRFNRALGCRFDVDEFESHLAQASRLRSITPEQAIRPLQEAAGLYRGEFVEELLEGEWFMFRREELRRKYLDAVLDLGQLLFAQCDYARAAESYRRAIEKEAVLETAHRELMRCLARLGERGQALRHFQTLTQIMHDELGAPPAPESVALYERLKQGEEI